MSEPEICQHEFYEIQRREVYGWKTREVCIDLQSATSVRDGMKSRYKGSPEDWRIVRTVRTDVSEVVE